MEEGKWKRFPFFYSFRHCKARGNLNRKQIASSAEKASLP